MQTLKEFNEYLASCGFKGERPYEHDYSATITGYECTKCGHTTLDSPMFSEGDETDYRKCPPGPPTERAEG